MKQFLDLQCFAGNSELAESAAEPGEAAMDPGAAERGEEQKDQKPADDQKPKYTDRDLDEILNRKFARWQEKQQKAVDEAKKLAEMDAQQKAEYERDQLREELASLKRQASLAEMTKTARKILSDSGISVPDELLSVMVTTDAEETKTAVDGFADAFHAAVESAVKERLKGEPPRRGSGSTQAMTREQIMAIRDPELRQRKMLENRELFNI